MALPNFGALSLNSVGAPTGARFEQTFERAGRLREKLNNLLRAQPNARRVKLLASEIEGIQQLIADLIRQRDEAEATIEAQERISIRANSAQTLTRVRSQRMLDEVSRKLADANRQLAALRTELGTKQAEVEELQRLNRSLSAEATELRAELESVRAELERVRQLGDEREQAAAEQAAAQLSELSATLVQARRELEATAGELRQLQGVAETLQDRLDKCDADLQRCEREKTTLLLEIEELEDEIDAERRKPAPKAATALSIPDPDPAKVEYLRKFILDNRVQTYSHDSDIHHLSTARASADQATMFALCSPLLTKLIVANWLNDAMLHIAAGVPPFVEDAERIDRSMVGVGIMGFSNMGAYKWNRLIDNSVFKLKGDCRLLFFADTRWHQAAPDGQGFTLETSLVGDERRDAEPKLLKQVLERNLPLPRLEERKKLIQLFAAQEDRKPLRFLDLGLELYGPGVLPWLPNLLKLNIDLMEEAARLGLFDSFPYSLGDCLVRQILPDICLYYKSNYISSKGVRHDYSGSSMFHNIEVYMDLFFDHADPLMERMAQHGQGITNEWSRIFETMTFTGSQLAKITHSGSPFGDQKTWILNGRKALIEYFERFANKEFLPEGARHVESRAETPEYRDLVIRMHKFLDRHAPSNWRAQMQRELQNPDIFGEPKNWSFFMR